MPRRKKKRPDAATAVLIILGGFGVFLLLKTLVESNAIPFLLIAAACVGVLIIVVQVLRRNRVLETVDAITNRHIAELVRQRTILIRSDPYGRPMLDKWHSHVDEFVTHHVRSAVSRSQQSIVDKRRAIISQRILHRVEEAITQNPALLTLPEKLPPGGLEFFCPQ